MTNSPHKYVFALAVIAVGGCSKNNKVVGPEVDVLAQDTTLELAAVSPDPYTAPQDPLAILSAPSAAATGSVATAASRPAVDRRAEAKRVSSRARSRSIQRLSTQSSTRAATRRGTVPQPEESTPRVVQDATSRQTVIASGSLLSLATEPRICANSSNVGDRVETFLVEPLAATNGISIPKGATAVARVSSVTRTNRVSEDGGIGLQIESISFKGRTYPVSSDVTYAEFDRVRTSSRASAASKVAAGTVLGGALGQVLGRNTRSTVIGAAGGAAAGAIVAHRTGSINQCVPSGGRLTARLTQPLIIEAST